MLKLYVCRQEVVVETFKFPAGETSVRIKDDPNRTLFPDGQGKIPVRIICSFESNDDLINLFLLTDAVRNFYFHCSIELDIAYFPYARQDRICNSGESLSVKVIANLINSQNYERVYISDAHSDVTPALINNCFHANILNAGISLKGRRNVSNTILVSPDAGANKKVFEFAKVHGYPEVVRADKTRDVATGKITGTKVYWEGAYIDPTTIKSTNKDFLIMDDILDAGGTFIPLAKELKKLTTGKVYLYVTHALFTKGYNGLDVDITKIYTRNLMNKTIDPINFIEVI